MLCMAVLPNALVKFGDAPMSKIIKFLYFIIVIISGIIVCTFVSYKIFITPPDVKNYVSSETKKYSTSGITPTVDYDDYGGKERISGRYTFLLVGSDASNILADVIMVAMYDTENQSVGIVSIPRDTLVDPSGLSHYPKINSALQYGIDTLQEIVSEMLGIPIDYFLKVNLDGFIQIINCVGGIEFEVPVHMCYDDPVQGLSIHYEPGIYNLTGREALEVCRLRYNDDGTVAYPDYDIGRTKTQRAVLFAIAEKAMSHPEKILDYLKIWYDNVETDLSFSEVLWFADKATDFDLNEDSVSSMTLPGNGNTTFNGAKFCYELYPEDVLNIVNKLVNPFESLLSIEDLALFQSD